MNRSLLRLGGFVGLLVEKSPLPCHSERSADALLFGL